MKMKITYLVKTTAGLLALLFLISTISFGQTSAVTGTVMNENGELLSGVTVKVINIQSKESFTTVTNEKGLFSFPSLKIGNSYSLHASYVGYEMNGESKISPTQNGNNSVLIRLQPANNALNEVVVIGYGTQKRETVTGAIATVTAKDFNTGQINDPITLIAGKVAGLSLSNTDRSDPNAGADFSLRGPATATGYNAGPLVVIDGVPGGDLQTIAPNDIASIDVLKDGSAASIYGSRATAGVIIVTTKRGRAGAVKVNYSGYVTTSTIAKKYDVLNAEQYKALGDQLQQQGNDVIIDDQGGNTNWFDAVTRTPVTHSHNLSLSGGTEKTTYYGSINYRNLQGIDLRSKREFVNGTFRLNTKALNDKIEFGLIVVNSFDTKSFANYGAIAHSLDQNPTYKIYNDDGSFFQNDDPTGFHLMWNPVANIYQNTYNNKEKRFLGTVNTAYHITSSLTANVTYSLTKQDYLNGSFSDIDDYFQLINGTNGTASRSEDNTTNNVLETTLNFDKAFGDHHLNVIAGYSYQDIFNEGFSAGNNNFITNAYGYNNLGAGIALTSLNPSVNRSGLLNNLGSYADERTILAYFGRAIYDYKQKYLLNVSIRREGASVLGADNKWGNFPGISAGWILSKEDFLANSNVIKFLKLRAGYGVTGNQNALNPYQSLATIGPFPFDNSSTQQSYLGTPDAGRWIIGYGPNINANPLLKWETKYETNIGLDFTLFKNGWLNGSLDLYDRRIKNLIGYYPAQIPSQIQTSTFANAGTMENKGIELLLNAKLISNANFTWNLIATAAYNKNEILSVTSDQFHGGAVDVTRVAEDVFIQRLAPGEPVAVFYGPVFDKLQDGQWRFKSKDGKSIASDELTPNDYQYLGNSIPKYTYGLTNNFSIGKFDVSILMKGAAGFKAVNAKRMFHENLNFYSRNNLFTSALNSPVNDALLFSSYYIEDAAYIKVDNLNIGYTIPIKKSAYIQNVHLYLTASNLLTITGFSGVDPELQINYYPPDLSQETDNGPGLESNYSYYPSTRVFTLGIDINF